MTHILSLDVGTSSIKAIIYNKNAINIGKHQEKVFFKKRRKKKESFKTFYNSLII